VQEDQQSKIMEFFEPNFPLAGNAMRIYRMVSGVALGYFLLVFFYAIAIRTLASPRFWF
jgi:hypothetical protein